MCCKASINLYNMKRTPLLLFCLVACASCLAQDADVVKPPSKESEAYHTYRGKVTTPPYGLQKVNELIKHIKSKADEQNDGSIEALSATAYASLSLREKFTYNMTHAESYSQNCDAMPPIQDEQKKIFGQLPDLFGEGSWSDRQL